MNNTSTGKPPTSQTSKKRLIIDEIGRDTKTGIIGRGYSPDNGKTFYVLDTIYGRLYGDDDIEAIWINGVSNRVKSEVNSATAEIPAVKSAADEAVKKADSAIASSKVNSDAIVAQSEAISEAKAAMERATAEIQQTASNAASDAAKIRADVAQVQNEVDTAKAANSASVEALKSDVSAAKQDIQAARQANENVAKQLDDYTKQAQAQGKTIKDIQNAQDGYTATLADVKGNVSKISDAVDGLSASLKDDQNNVATIKAKADELSATLTDHDKNIAQLTASAKELGSTLEDADGRISKVEQTASTLTNEFSDQDGRLSKVEQTTTGTQQMVANQQGQINSIQTDAAGIHETLTGQGNQIANINVTLSGLNSKYEGVSGDLGKLKNGAMQNRGTVSAPDFNSLTAAGFYTITHPYRGKNYPTGNWGTLEVSGQTSDSNGRLNQKYVSDNNAEIYVRQYNANTKSWTAWIKTANQNDVTALSNRITTNSTQITQNKQAIALKADQSTVNNLSGEVSQAQAQLKVQAGQISSKVSSEDFKTLDNKVGGAIAQIDKNTTAIDQTKQKISLKADQMEVDQVKQTATQNSSRLDVMANEIKSKVTSTDVNNIVDGKGYATTSTVQSLITQKAGKINETITNLQGNLQNVTADLTGLQSTVKDKADQSQITQLTNVVQSKVSSDDFNSKYTQLSNMIDARVSKDDLIGEINLQAGSTLIRNKKIFLDGETVIFGDKTKAFIPSAAIENLEADKITTGTLNGVEIRQLETGGRSIDIKNGNIAITSHDPYEPRISFTNDGKNMKMFNALGDIEVLNQEFSLFNFTPDDTSSTNPIPFFRVVNTGNTGSGSAHLYMDHAIFDGCEWWTPSAGVTFGRTWNGVDKSSDYADIYAKSFVPHSELSAKTRIKKLDRKEALDKIMQDDMYTYQFKEDVRDGVSKRYASFIIDNVHDVAQYAEPEEFLSANGKGRDDGTQLAYLIAAVQYQQEQIEELKKKLEEK